VERDFEGETKTRKDMHLRGSYNDVIVSGGEAGGSDLTTCSAFDTEEGIVYV